jgi:putative CocE/NonD family hydrolase
MLRLLIRVIRSRRIALVPVLLAATVLVARLVAHSPDSAAPQDRIGVAIPMQDGVRLAADVFLPPGPGPWPTVLVRTPYGRKSAGIRSYRYFVRRRYAVVIQDVRGRFGSQGSFRSIQQEGPDGSDTITWIAAQPWSNGRVAMAGSSYLGMAQWWAAIEDNPHLITISPMDAGDDEYLDRSYSPGGALQFSHRLVWLRENFMPRSQVNHGFGPYLDHLPVFTSDLASLGIVLPRWREILDHPSYDEFWRNLSIGNRLSRIKIPVLSFGGWFDTYAEGDLDAFSRLAAEGQAVETWIGPWWHNPALKFPTRDFGPLAAPALRRTQAAWFDQWLKTNPEGARQDPKRAVLHLFVMGPNVWRDEHEWPLARTRYTPLYLASKGRANSAAGDGVLRWNPGRRARPDTFIYDPAHPVPTTGGATCCDSKLVPPGPLDQTVVERRNDVLVYTSPPLARDLEVTGPVRVILYVATSASDTDFTAKLVDVEPDSRPLLVTDGILRLRYRLSLKRPVFVQPDTPYRIEIDAGVTSYVFAAGHRLRVEIASSNFPRFDRNLNSTRPNALEARITTARQTVFHNGSHPSAIVLPVIPQPGASRGVSAFRRRNSAG